jgi:hypothetical protein
VGTSIHSEYWIPAEELPAFNEAIVGTIEVVRRFGPPSAGEKPEGSAPQRRGSGMFAVTAETPRKKTGEGS